MVFGTYLEPLIFKNVLGVNATSLTGPAALAIGSSKRDATKYQEV